MIQWKRQKGYQAYDTDGTQEGVTMAITAEVQKVTEAKEEVRVTRVTNTRVNKEVRGDTNDTRGTGVRVTKEDGTRTGKVTKGTKEEAKEDTEARGVTQDGQKEAEEATREVNKEAKEEVKRVSHVSPSVSAHALTAEARATSP